MIAGHLICRVIDKYQELKGSKYRAMRHTTFYDILPKEVAAQIHCKSSVLKRIFRPADYLEMDPHCCRFPDLQAVTHRANGFREV